MLYRFQFELSDIDRGVYETLEFRLAQHPSETLSYLFSRALAYSLSYREGLEFSPEGLNDPDAPALRALSPHGSIDLWIEIGNPAARRLHKATKAAKQVVIYTYKNVEPLLAEIRAGNVHRANEVEIYGFDSKFLQELEPHLSKNNRWTVIFQQGQLNIEVNGASITTEVRRYFIG